MKTGIIGCGTISTIYAENARDFDHIQIVACADMNMHSAEDLCMRTGVGTAVSVEDLLDDPEIGLVINLTPPAVHAVLSKRILQAGKHLYSEKPLALDTDSARELIDIADASSLAVGCAPDTFLGSSIQKAKRIIGSGGIGTPVAFTAAMTTPGHERWHPNPDFYYQSGGGPLWDMGPYYLSALIACLGPVAAVTATTITSAARRVIATGPRAGEVLAVEVPTTIEAVLTFCNGVIGTLLMSFDIHQTHLPPIEIYGTGGSLKFPDPNFFGGVLQLYTKETGVWSSIPAEGRYTDNNRGLGIELMCAHLETGAAYTNTGRWACHIVAVIEGIFRSSETHQRCMIEAEQG
ncbi:MAG: Gfo/Idh/MocA family oxidoreductase [Spirochaetia bacterium]|nr:Gfo/Idh/MocA family oxidoreductase [Spirochaetia bacterium]